MQENPSLHKFPSYTAKSARKSRIIVIIVVVVLLIGALLGGLYFLGAKQKSSQSVTPTPTQVPTQTPMPTATPSATLSPSPTRKPTAVPTKSVPTPTKAATTTSGALQRSDLSLAVLNGSGVSGAAKEMSSYLSGLGYAIKTVGNADNENYAGITVRVKKSKSDYLSLLKSDIAKKSASVSASVSDTIGDDAEVIVGK